MAQKMEKNPYLVNNSSVILNFRKYVTKVSMLN